MKWIVWTFNSKNVQAMKHSSLLCSCIPHAMTSWCRKSTIFHLCNDRSHSVPKCGVSLKWNASMSIVIWRNAKPWMLWLRCAVMMLWISGAERWSTVFRRKNAAILRESKGDVVVVESLFSKMTRAKMKSRNRLSVQTLQMIATVRDDLVKSTLIELKERKNEK